MNATEERSYVENATCNRINPDHKLLVMYQLCTLDYGHLHQWMAFIDSDEFLVFMNPENDTAADNLPALLREYEAFGGLAVNWRTFGSGEGSRNS